MSVAMLQENVPPYANVHYVSYGNHLYKVSAPLLPEDLESSNIDLLLFPPHCLCCKAGGKTPLRITRVHAVPYDGAGKRPHSWHNKTTEVRL